jgi:transcriptional regulator with XRE-family HTH domain
LDDRFIKKLESLEGIYGQKEAARRLGVNVSTFRAWKTEKRSPREDKVKKTNRVFGQAKGKLSKPDIQERIERTKRTTERKRTAREKNIRENPRLQSARSWVNSLDTISGNNKMLIIGAGGTEYVATVGDSAQFIRDVGRYGKPKGTRRITMIGLYTSQYETWGGEMSEDITTVSQDMMIVAGVKEDWDLQKFISYLEEKFYSLPDRFIGRRNYTPSRFIGYKL